MTMWQVVLGLACEGLLTATKSGKWDVILHRLNYPCCRGDSATLVPMNDGALFFKVKHFVLASNSY
jgi:hypothetical protein